MPNESQTITKFGTDGLTYSRLFITVCTDHDESITQYHVVNHYIEVINLFMNFNYIYI